MTSNPLYPFDPNEIPVLDRQQIAHLETLWEDAPPNLSERQALRQEDKYTPLLSHWKNTFPLDKARYKLLAWFVSLFTLEEFYSPDLQGVPDIDSPLSDAHGVWVHSLLSTLDHLLAKNRLQNDTLYALHSLGSLFQKSTHKEHYLSLIRSVLHELAFPENISCFFPEQFSATMAQTLLALKEPAQYVELAEKVSSLEVLDVPKMFYFGTTLSSRLIQPALLENSENLTDIMAGQMWMDGSFKPVTLTSQADLPDFIDTLAQYVGSGEAVPLCLGFDHKDPNLQLLVLRVDRQHNEIFFLNLQGDLLQLPLIQFETLLENALEQRQAQVFALVLNHMNPSSHGTHADALSQWPGGDLTPAELSSYQLQMSHWLLDLALSAALTSEQRKEIDTLLKRCSKLGLFPVETYGRLASLFQHQTLIEPVLTRLNSILDKDRLSHFLRLIDETSRSIAQGNLPLEMGERILDDRPERYLTTLQMNQLVENIQQGKTDLICRILARMDDNKDKLIRHCQILGIPHDKLEHWLKQGMSFLELEHFFMTLEPDEEMNQIVSHFLGSLTKVEALRSLFRRLVYLKTMRSQGILSENEALQGLLYYQSGNSNGDADHE